MIDLIRVATEELTRFLSAKLPELSADWWERHVVERLSFQQQRLARERGLNSLQQLDLAALLRVLDQSWHELSGPLGLPREGRSWVRELQTVRNKWAHLSAEAMPASEIYRDADTLGRLLQMIGAKQASLDVAAAAKAAAVAEMAGNGAVPAAESMVPAGVAAALPIGPISLFKAGDLVSLRSHPETVLPVIEVVPGGAECRYIVFQNNNRTAYYESQLQAVPDSSGTRKTLSARQFQAAITGLQIESPTTASLYSLRSGRVQFVPYQYRPVLKFIRSDRPRLLIADEVGVGKTIEAGLILKELRARTDLSSVLVICPKALVAERKWLLEMKRFDEHFTALDGPLLRHCLQETHLEGEWPEQYGRAILPFSLFDSDLLFGRSGRGKNKDKGLLKLDPPPRFDLVIVDEAHHIRNPATLLHEGVRYFCDNAEAVLFLTATPVQLGSEDLYTLLKVLRPDLVIDRPSFEQMAAPNPYINEAVKHCRAARNGWQSQARVSLTSAAQTEWGRIFLREAPDFQRTYDRLGEDHLGDADRVECVRSIEELYTFSGLINRTRRRDIGEFTTRKPETVAIAFTAAQQELHDGLLGLISRILSYCHGQQNVKFMMTTIRRQAASSLFGLVPFLQDLLARKIDQLELAGLAEDDEEPDLGFMDQARVDIERLLSQAQALDHYDPKAEAFLRVLSEKNILPNNKALVFSTFRHTLAYLSQLVGQQGLRYGLVHGGVPDDERFELRRRFALPKEDPEALEVLLSSEVGCEGLDYQFCDFLVNYDLPWNPMRIEQRIGRIDRYGQKSETVAVINFITPGTVDADIYERCLWRIGVFQHAVGGNEEILGEVARELRGIAESFELTPRQREQRLRQLADNGIRQIREEQELENRQAELFGLSVPVQSWQKEVAAADSAWLSPAALQRCVTVYLEERFGPGQDYLLGEKPAKTLRLGQEARTALLADYRQLRRAPDPAAREWEKWLKGVQPNLAVTFDQDGAAENPKASQLSVLHPLVRQAARFSVPTEYAYVALRAKSRAIPAGEYSFAVYRWTKTGVKTDQAMVPVASDPAVETQLMSLLCMAIEATTAVSTGPDRFSDLEAMHYTKWKAARVAHMAENEQLVGHRIQSLTASHRARCRAVEDQVRNATDERIRLMRQGELTRANGDFDRRMDGLKKAANSADIHATPVAMGRITVISGEE